MSEEGLKMYLFLLQGKDGCETKESYVAVKQAQINETIAESTERVGKFGVIFTTKMELPEVNKNLNIKKRPYMLVELTDRESIAGFFPETDIEELKSLNLENLKDNVDLLEREIEKAVAVEDYLRAAKLKKELDKKKE